MHRDIKPANVFITADGGPILMDMGVVEVAADTDATLHTSVGDFIGTVRYAAPQFIQGEQFDFADDVYSFGATLYLAVTGREVFSDVGRKPLLPHFVLTQRPRVGEVRSGFPPQLSVLLEGCLHPERRRRPSLAEIAEFLQKPDKATYLQRELDARNREKRDFEVIAVHDDGATVLADLPGVKPREVDYSVVREVKPVRVPSLGGDIKPEKWIAYVQLKHVRNNVGHFAVQSEQWQEGKPPPVERAVRELAGSPGQWFRRDRQRDTVKIGDVVVEAED